MTSSAAPQVVHVGCPHNCPDACLMDVTVEDGRAVRLAGHRDHPYTRGALCGKVNRFLERVYSDERLLYPVKRVGPKGPGARFERISWEEAIAVTAGKMREAIDRHGPESILPYSYSGTLGIYQGWGMDRRFANVLGTSVLYRSICDGAYMAAIEHFPDLIGGFPPEGLERSNLIIFWGANPLNTGMHVWRHVLEAKKRGAKVITIDPYLSRTARSSDEHIPIRPGTDAALAMGMMKVIVEEGLVDHDYVQRFTVGYEQLLERLRALSLDELAHTCDLPVSTIQRLAREYAASRPAALRIGFGVQRTGAGYAAVRAISCLPALTGAWRDVGGGYWSWGRGMADAQDADRAARTDLIPPGTRVVNMMRLAEHLLDPNLDPPIQVLYFYNFNTIALPDQNTVRRALQRDDLFIAVHDLFLTDAADYADIVMPATSTLEHDDLVLSAGHDHASYSRAAIAPLGESRTSQEVFQSLARALGVQEPALYLSPTEFVDDVLSDAVSKDELYQQPFVNTADELDLLPFAEGGFETPSGKWEFYAERLIEFGLDPLPGFTPPHETLQREGPFPFNFLSRKHKDTINANYTHLPVMQRQEATARTLEMHPDDAARKDLADGARVRVFNDRGEFVIPLRLSTRVRPGTVATYWGYWDKRSNGRGTVNNVTSPLLTDVGGGATFYDCQVDVERFDGPC